MPILFQRAQPIRFSHWLLSYGFFFQSDCERLTQLQERVDVMPLGSGAISGNPLDINRHELAELLNFKRVSMNSMNAVSDRDFVCEFNFVSSMISIHLSRLSEDLILYSTKEFNFVKLSNDFCTGSSLMPQKLNPDSIELVRGTSGGIIGQLVSMLTTLKGLPSTYNKDLQNDKESMFYVFDKIVLSLKVMLGVIDTLEIFEENCRNALSYEMLATDLAYYLVRKGMPFRDAHHCASMVVDAATKSRLDISKLPLAEFQAISEKFTEDVYDIFSFEKSVEQYQVTGGTSKRSVMEQITHLKAFVAKLMAQS
jgi:argininosuccinate lyase